MRRTIAVAALAAFVAAGCSSQAVPDDRSPAPQAPPPPQSPPAAASAEPPAASPVEQLAPGPAEPLPVLPDPARLPPLPAVGFRPPRPIDTVHAAYRFAALHPEVLRYVPCFCGCERDGHQDNEDCFVESRAPDGTVSWDAHGLG